MKLSDYKKDFYGFTSDASEVNRKASFAGIALVWVFKTSSLSLPPELLVPATLFAIALALDLFHYVLASAIWGVFYRYHESRLAEPTDDPELSHPSSLSTPIYVAFIAKLFATSLGYIMLFAYVYNRTSAGTPPA